MGNKTFFQKVDAMLVDISDNTDVGVLGPNKFGIWCCSTCSFAALEGDGFEKFVYYHQQDADRDGSDVYLGWLGEIVPEIVKQYARKHGLTFEWDGDEGRKLYICAHNQ